MYSNEGLIAWIRSNGFYADIHAGAIDESHLEAFGTYFGLATGNRHPLFLKENNDSLFCIDLVKRQEMFNVCKIFLMIENGCVNKL